MIKNPLVDTYIIQASDFAQPILLHLRNLVHSICPDTEEKIKWGMPFFDYKKMPLCYMAAFKQHCAFGFWKAPLMKDRNMFTQNNEEGMGSLGKIISLKSLPKDKQIKQWIQEAMLLNEQGIKLPKKEKSKKELVVPENLLVALQKNKKALTCFEHFSPACKKEYCDWITEAKTDTTKEKRILQAVNWMAEGKKRNWKYEK